ncbi:hypothetical protein IYX23_18610 [Methylocystis sp. L43]|jgi:hypothetical protein|uniref:hypothetical protein n=1 Tax=unclassified Methylocystis TaxID=2625913 RepID=UPI0018C2F955|nr:MULTISPECIES: hypothetical protein [unclassified Methylocystis]MBG0799683.1 hypothetical protein [Methylocystis sp. L43]MBG0807466.1 hypothetical protein [Methylocystis sp. H15]
MSEETSSQPEDTVSRSELTNLQEQLKATRMERDRQIFEKSEIVAKANAYAKERDDVRDSLAAMTAERDRLAAENAGASTKALEMSRQLEAANRRADEATAEVVRLRHAIATAPSSDPAVVLWSLISEKTRDGVAWVRGKFPADSPALPWFDKTVSLVTQIGCMAVKAADAFIRWAVPKAIELFNKGKAELEARMEKK